PVVGDVGVQDDVVIGVRDAVRAGALQVDGRVRDRRLVVLVRLLARVELVAGGGEVGDADDLPRGAGRGVVLAPVPGCAVALGEELVGQQPAALVGGHARVGRDGRRRDPARGRHGAGVLVVRRRAGEGGEAGEALLVDDPLAQRAALRGRVLVLPRRVGGGALLDRAVPPALVHVGVRDRRVHAGVVLPVVVDVLVDGAAQPAEPAGDAQADLAVRVGVVDVHGLPGGDRHRLEPDDVAELLVPDRHVVGAGRHVLDVEVAGGVA